MSADAVALLDRGTGLSLLDSALHNRQIAAADLPTVSELAAGRRGASTVRELVAYADGRAAVRGQSARRSQVLNHGQRVPTLRAW